MSNTIPTVAEQVELATRVHEIIGRVVGFPVDRSDKVASFTVVRVHNELRFFGRAKFQGDNPPSAHVAVLRSDLAKAQTLPCAYQDRQLAERCESLVRHALGRLS